MNFRKLKKFIKMNGYEKHRSIVRNTYSFLNKRAFKAIGKKSYFLDADFLSGTKYMTIGNDVGIWNHARVEVLDEWNGKKFSPKVIIGDHVNIGQNLHLTCAESIIIEKNVVCTARVTITDITHCTDDKNLAVLNQDIITRPVVIREGAFIGINATILPGVIIGKHAIVGANAVVTKAVPDYATVAGVPAKVIGENIYG